MSEPFYWQHETSGWLRPAVEAYLNEQPLTGEQVAAMRAYLRQWIMADIWELNPHATGRDRATLAALRTAVDRITARDSITRWLDDAEAIGIDPL